MFFFAVCRVREILRRKLLWQTDADKFSHLLCVLQVADVLVVPAGQTHDIGAHGKILRPERA